MNLLIGKRQIVLAALVVTLSLAVFVNWYYTNGETVIEPESTGETRASADTAGSALFVGADGSSPEAQPVDAPGRSETTTAQTGETSEQTTAGTPETTAQATQENTELTTQQTTEQTTQETTAQQVGETEPVASGGEVGSDLPIQLEQELTGSDALSPQGDGQDEYFASARLSRTNAFDESVETLQQIIESNDGNSQAAVNAADEISAITAVLQLETSLEALITAKTGSECIAVISDNSVSIVVENEKITDEMILGIHGILSDNSLTMENITITGC